MELTSYVDRYYLNRHVERSTLYQLQNAARKITGFAGGQLAVENLSSDLVNRWLLGRREAGLSPETLRSNRTSILMLWHAAAEEGLAPPVGKICRIKRKERVIRAFTLEELNALLSAADAMPGRFRSRSVLKRLYWRAFVMAAYDSGLRLSDLLLIRRRDIWWPDNHGTAILSLVQTKTGHAHRVHLRPETMQAVDACHRDGPERELVWPAVSRRHWYQRFKKLCKAAGVTGTSKLIRRSGATYVARELGEAAASRFLGHRSPELARKNYIDGSIAFPQAPLPPPLLVAIG